MDIENLDSVCLAGPIVIKNAEQRVVTGPVLVPGEKDSDGEVVTVEKIQQVALKFLESYGNIDVAHTFNNVAVPVESWITRTALKFQLPDGDSLDIPKGSWMMSSKVGNDSVWQGVLDGTYKGYSIAGIKVAEIEQAMKSKDVTAEEFFGAALKRKTLLRDLGDDWVAIAVSIVEGPSVFKSKWVAIKSTDTKNPLQRLKNLFKNTSNEKIVIKEDNEMDMDKFKIAMKEVAVEAMNEVVEEKVKPMIQAVEEKIPEKPAETKAEETKTETKSEDTRVTEEKTDPKALDLSDQIGVVQDELLKELQADVPDVSKIGKLNAKLDTLKEISSPEEEEKPEDMESMRKEIDELKKKFESGDGATKSRASTGQDGDWDTADKGEDDGLPQRDASGCVKKKRA